MAVFKQAASSASDPGRVTKASPAAVDFCGVTKRFGSVVANDRLNLRVERGTIHGIIGENGAGKSTAMKILSGLQHPDEGEIAIDGERCRWKSPADAIARGIGMVHQHFLLAGRFSALDNILLGAEPVRWGLLDRGEARRRLEVLSSQYGLPVDWTRPVEELSLGTQQRIEILKLLFRRAEVLILDEPTAVLTPQEAERLFRNLQRLRDEGKTILFVTHKLKEVMAFTDRVTVLRAGRVTGNLETAHTSLQELADLMVGRKVALTVEPPAAQPGNEPALELTGLTLGGQAGSRQHLFQVSFTVNRSEIVGIAGVEGNGQAELVQAILHPAEKRCRTSGSIRLLGREVSHWPTLRIRESGVAVIPPDRLREGLLPDRPLDENFLLGRQSTKLYSRAGLLQWSRIRSATAAAIQAYDVRPGGVGFPAGSLSGGNQQKLIVAREFQRAPRLLIAAQPTRGVDVGAIEFIHGRIVAARDAGAAVLLISSDLDEILALADRILVMYEGRVVAEYGRGQVSEKELGLKMGGA